MSRHHHSHSNDYYNSMSTYNNVDWQASENKQKPWYKTTIGLIIVGLVVIFLLWWFMNNVMNTNTASTNNPNYTGANPFLVTTTNLPPGVQNIGCYIDNPLSPSLTLGGGPISPGQNPVAACQNIAFTQTAANPSGQSKYIGLQQDPSGNVLCFFDDPGLPPQYQRNGPSLTGCDNIINGVSVGRIGVNSVYKIRP